MIHPQLFALAGPNGTGKTTIARKHIIGRIQVGELPIATDWFGETESEPDVWGIGRRSAEKLGMLGVKTAADLRDMEPRRARQVLTVVGERIVYELRGLSCLPLDQAPAPRKTTAVTRSFGTPVTEWEPMREAVAAYATRAGEKLRAEGLAAEALQVFMHTSPFRPGPAYSNAATVELRPATDDTFALIAAATSDARRIWRDGFAMSGAGVQGAAGPAGRC
ncbi:hypothetical protein [Azospirillum formosense]|uniref:DinB/UmuC family translesion DNA polymerase n=1 Tax=Azospirillum formosense TaxID=861533 RepID=UPI001C8FCC73|nr:hypothetical protein [Azospirillum formosense]MBY3757071.1 hypothetical protein [Azospirillum formosense]